MRFDPCAVVEPNVLAADYPDDAEEAERLLEGTDELRISPTGGHEQAALDDILGHPAKLEHYAARPCVLCRRRERGLPLGAQVLMECSLGCSRGFGEIRDGSAHIFLSVDAESDPLGWVHGIVHVVSSSVVTTR